MRTAGDGWAILGPLKRRASTYVRLVFQWVTGGRPKDWGWRNVGVRLGNIANVYQAQGKNERAIDLFEQVVAIAQEVETRRVKASPLGTWGSSICAARHERAFRHEQAIKMTREMGVGQRASIWSTR